MKFLCISIVLLYFLQVSIAGYGDEEEGYPSWQERAAHTITNVVRTDPTNYVAKYGYDYDYSMKDILNGYVPKPPLYYVLGLTKAARIYSEFMAKDTCLGHNFCNGTNLGPYLTNFYSCASSGYAENINVNHDEPRANINQWLCDGIPCAAPGSFAGHRDTILGKLGIDLWAIGNGFATRQGAKYNSYWTQDYGKDVCPPISNKVASGSHIFQNAGKTKFIATFYDSKGQGPKEASVVIDGTKLSLGLDLGTPALGTYILEVSSASSCRNYYFYFQDSTGNEYYYPETGSLSTFKEGSCTTAWVAGRGSGSGSTISNTVTSSDGSVATSTSSTSADATVTSSSSSSDGAVATSTGPNTVLGEITTGPVTTDGTTTGAAPNLFFGTTICYMSLVIEGDFSSFDSVAFAKNFADALGISSSRILIQSVGQGSFGVSTKVDFTLLEMTGEQSSQDVMNAAFKLVFSRDAALTSRGINVYTVSGYYFQNSNGGSIPSTADATPAFYYDATQNQESAAKSSNGALIGGIVGGAVGLVAIVAAVVAIVIIRKRRAQGAAGSFY